MIQFRMTRIQVNQFAILSDTLDGSNNIDIECAMGFRASNLSIAVSAKFTFSADVTLMLIDVTCVFDIDGVSWDSMVQNDGKLLIPKGFLAHLAMHTVGTMRGVLHCKTEGTPFNVLILPPLNVSDMIPEDVTLEIMD